MSEGSSQDFQRAVSETAGAILLYAAAVCGWGQGIAVGMAMASILLSIHGMRRSMYSASLQEVAALGITGVLLNVASRQSPMPVVAWALAMLVYCLLQHTAERNAMVVSTDKVNVYPGHAFKLNNRRFESVRSHDEYHTWAVRTDLPIGVLVYSLPAIVSLAMFSIWR